MSMNKSIIVGLVALGLTACGGAVEDQPTDAVTAEAPADEAAAPSASEPAAEPVVEVPAAEVVEAPVAQ
jgi:hypothetical protein